MKQIAKVDIKIKKYNNKLKDIDNCEFFAFDSADNLIKDLEVLLFFLTKSVKDKYMIKWSIILIHTCLMEFMLKTIRLDKWKPVTKNNNEQLLSLITLYEKCISKDYNLIKDSKKKKQLVKQLNDLRNNFIHPYYDYNLIDKELVKKIFNNSITIITELFLNNSVIISNPSKLTRLIDKINIKIKEI